MREKVAYFLRNMQTSRLNNLRESLGLRMQNFQGIILNGNFQICIGKPSITEMFDAAKSLKLSLHNTKTIN